VRWASRCAPVAPRGCGSRGGAARARGRLPRPRQ
jgi:hypothetical protein